MKEVVSDERTGAFEFSQSETLGVLVLARSHDHEMVHRSIQYLIIEQLEVTKSGQHASDFLRALTGASTIAPLSWQACMGHPRCPTPVQWFCSLRNTLCIDL
jgi:hypothetical protein